MTEQNPQGERPEGQEREEEPRVMVIGPDGLPMAAAAQGSRSSGDDEDEDEARHITDLVEQPAKVMRIGSMIRQLLDEVKAAPLDEASRARLAGIHASSIKELEAGLAPELVDELERLSLPFSSETPSEAELRIAQAQLVGWLEGLFHGIQTAIYAQQVAARAQLEQMRRALPPGMVPDQAQMAAAQQAAAQRAHGEEQSGRGMYL
jgi:proteasome activator-like protein